MVLLKLLLVTATFYELFADLNARRTCPKGQRVTSGKNGCEDCPSEAYQPGVNDKMYCQSCTRCDSNSGSVVKEKCTQVTNTICQCRGEFVPWERDSSTCKCDIGFGLDGSECSKCKDGYFSSRIDSPCKKWTQCKCGVKIAGSNTADVVCEALGCSDASNSHITPPTTNKDVSPVNQHPHEGVHASTTITTASPGPTVISSTRPPVQPSDSSATYTGTGMAFLLFGIIGLLVLTAVTCKLHITPPPIQTNDSLCRKPVEESGEGSLMSVKLNLEEN